LIVRKVAHYTYAHSLTGFPTTIRTEWDAPERANYDIPSYMLIAQVYERFCDITGYTGSREHFAFIEG
jgi:hypothetical protein